jgi:hypothetical protein
LTRTYVDSGVLIAAACGGGRLGECALAVLQDSAREFVSSDYIKMEVLPKPIHFRRGAEIKFYNAYFSRVSIWLNFDASHLQAALKKRADPACNPMTQSTSR